MKGKEGENIHTYISINQTFQLSPNKLIVWTANLELYKPECNVHFLLFPPFIGILVQDILVTKSKYMYVRSLPYYMQQYKIMKVPK